MERKLASIKRINNLYPIEGKDRIELAQIDGWTVIVKKGEFNIGDLCVYIEIDSILPEKPEFEFLRNKNFTIKTMKMAGCISQGIVFPLSILPEGKYNLEDDVTDIIGVKKWERQDSTDVNVQIKKASKNKYPKFLMKSKIFREIIYKLGDHRESKGFPSFIQKTDETRIQNAPFYLNSNEEWILTEKIDGQSGTFAVVKRKKLFKTTYEYIVCSRNIRLYNKDNSSYWEVSDKYNIKKHLIDFLNANKMEWIAIQGECISPKVQGNKYKVSEPDLYVFNVILPHGRMDSLTAQWLINKWGMKFVPIVGKQILPKTVDEMLKLAHGESALGNTIREGLVCRTSDGVKSFKAVDPLFLIKYNE